MESRKLFFGLLRGISNVVFPREGCCGSFLGLLRSESFLKRLSGFLKVVSKAQRRQLLCTLFPVKSILLNITRIFLVSSDIVLVLYGVSLMVTLSSFGLNFFYKVLGLFRKIKRVVVFNLWFFSSMKV